MALGNWRVAKKYVYVYTYTCKINFFNSCMVSMKIVPKFRSFTSWTRQTSSSFEHVSNVILCKYKGKKFLPGGQRLCGYDSKSKHCTWMCSCMCFICKIVIRFIVFVLWIGVIYNKERSEQCTENVTKNNFWSRDISAKRSAPMLYTTRLIVATSRFTLEGASSCIWNRGRSVLMICKVHDQALVSVSTLRSAIFSDNTDVPFWIASFC